MDKKSVNFFQDDTGRLSRTVLWEGWGEIPLPDPIAHKLKN
jgi:hypothetical protein